MATPTAAQVRTISLSSAFDAVPDATVDEAVRQVLQMYAAIALEPEHTDIVALTACHWLALLGYATGFNVGPVTSASAGGVSASFGVGAVVVDFALDATTPWGQRALALLRTLPPTVQGGGGSPW